MIRLLSLICVIAWSASVTPISWGESTDSLVGIWKADFKQPFFYQLSEAKNGVYEIPYGFERCGVWGTMTVERKGQQLLGRYKSGVDSGDIRIELGSPVSRAVLHWTDDKTKKTGSYGLIKVTSSFDDGMLNASPTDQAWRDHLIESRAKDAVRQRMTLADWTQQCQQIRREIEQARKWPKGWPLTQSIRQIGWNDWEIGWIEIDFLNSLARCNDRDKNHAVSKLNHHRFHQSEKPRSGFDAQHETSYRAANKSIIDQFMSKTSGRTGIEGLRYTRIYFAMWDYLTANESRGLVARIIREDGSPAKLGLYNDSHKTQSGRFEAVVRDGDREIAKASGTVTIPPYEEITTEIDAAAAYTFFAPHVTLSFVPDDYHMQPIPKDRVKPFHQTLDEYLAISNQETPEKDFLHAMLWARVEPAWEANDLLEYRRSVRDAGSVLYRFRGQQPEVKEYVRKHLMALETRDERSDLATAATEKKFEFEYDPIQGNLIHYNLRNLERLNPKVLASLDINQEEFASIRQRLSTRIGDAEPQDVTINARIESGKLYLDTAGYEVILTGTVTMFDGPVNIGSYSIVGYTNKEGVPFTNSCRTTTYYSDAPKYELDLDLHCYHKRPQSSGKTTFNLLNQLNQAGAFVQPRSLD